MEATQLQDRVSTQQMVKIETLNYSEVIFIPDLIVQKQPKPASPLPQGLDVTLGLQVLKSEFHFVSHTWKWIVHLRLVSTEQVNTSGLAFPSTNGFIGNLEISNFMNHILVFGQILSIAYLTPSIFPSYMRRMVYKINMQIVIIYLRPFFLHLFQFEEYYLINPQ